MVMGTRKEHQEEFWIPTCTLARPRGSSFYQRLNQLLTEHDFDRFVERKCQHSYAGTMGRPVLALGSIFGCCWSATSKVLSQRATDRVAGGLAMSSWADGGLVKGKPMGMEDTSLEANA